MKFKNINTQLKVFAHLVIGLLLGIFFYNFGDNGAHTLSNASLIFICVLYMGYTSMLPIALQVPGQLPLVQLESFNNWYQLKTYYITHFLISTPMHMVFSLAYSLPLYYLTGQPLEYFRFFFFVLILFLHGISGEATGVIIGSLFNPINGTFVGAVWLAFLVLVSGFLVFFNHMHTMFYYFSYISFLSYSFDGLMHTIYGMERDGLQCPSEEIFCYFNSPTQMLHEIGNDQFTIEGDIVLLVLYILGAKLVGYYTMSMKLKINTQLKVLAHLLIGFLLGALFYNFGNNGAYTLSNASLMFFCVLYMGYTSMIPIAIQVPDQLPFIQLESFNNWYQLKTYYISNFVISTPMHMIFSLAYSIPLYYLSGQPMEFFRFFLFVLILFLHGISGEATGVIIGSLFIPVNGTFVGAVWLAFLMLDAGFCVFFNHMHAIFYYFSYTSFVSCSFDGLMHAIYGMGRGGLQCPEEETFCYFTSPSQMLREIGNDNFSIEGDIAILALYIIVAKFVGYFTVSMKMKT